MNKAVDIVKANQVESNQWRKEAIADSGNWPWMRYSMQIALKVRSKMKMDGITQCVLASRLGCTQQYVSLILKGKENLTLETISKLESALQIKLMGNISSVDNYHSVLPNYQYLSDNCDVPYGKGDK